jgi:hypothetical protein
MLPAPGTVSGVLRLAAALAFALALFAGGAHAADAEGELHSDAACAICLAAPLSGDAPADPDIAAKTTALSGASIPAAPSPPAAPAIQSSAQPRAPPPEK